MADVQDLDLSAADLDSMTNWPEALVEDYINRGAVIRDLSERLEELEAKVAFYHP
jgi:hypothetical protein